MKLFIIKGSNIYFKNIKHTFDFVCIYFIKNKLSQCLNFIKNYKLRKVFEII